jgi:cell division transport system permease protein
MIATKIKRIIKAGAKSFTRNGSVSVASTLVMTVTLSVVASLIFVGALLQSTLQGIREKVDINVYLETTATESQAQALLTALQSRPEVEEVTYTSAEQALEAFRARHSENPLIQDALEEVGGNPLEASLNIRAVDPSYYQAIADFVQAQNVSGDGTVGIVNKISYIENKEAIDTLSRIIQSSEKLGLIVAIFFVLISMLITFNTVRLAIYTSKDEIGVMRLVGASSRYIKGPFIIIGVIYGIVGALITLIIFYPITYWLGPLTFNLGTGMNVFHYYLANFLQITGIVMGAGILLGVIASYLAVRKYINV